MTTSEDLANMTRPEKRRLWKEMNKKDDYEASSFWDMTEYKGVKVKASKYTPHVGTKQKSKNN